MAKIPVRFKRVSAAFDEIARARLCESSGSEHCPADNSEDLSVLVDSFFERDDKVEDKEEEKKKKKKEKEKSCSKSESYCTELEAKEALKSLTGGSGEDEDGRMKELIYAETELACRSLGSGSSEGFKRRVMSWLRHRGFDAGLCKSRWEKTAQYPAGKYEYIDIIIAGTRYIVELSPAANEFTVARPTNHYASLLEAFRPVLICKEDELKQVLRLMSAAMTESLKKRELHVPPWRRNGYMQAKWFGPYKRTTNAVPTATLSQPSWFKSGWV